MLWELAKQITVKVLCLKAIQQIGAKRMRAFINDVTSTVGFCDDNT